MATDLCWLLLCRYPGWDPLGVCQDPDTFAELKVRDSLLIGLVLHNAQHCWHNAFGPAHCIRYCMRFGFGLSATPASLAVTIFFRLCAIRSTCVMQCG